MKELLDEIVKLYFDYPEYSICECIEKAKEMMGWTYKH